jgi:hypothetical protein
MLLPDGLSKNAYRILSLSASASSSEVHKAAERARRNAALGLPPADDVDTGLLGSVSSSESDIRAAVSRLGNPTHRLKERLFWFHQPTGAQVPDFGSGDSAFAAGDLLPSVRQHDEALRGLFNAFRANFEGPGAALWVRALRRWHAIVSDDSYWALSLAVENRGGFEPRALPGEVESLRLTAVSLAAHGLLVAGRDAVNRGDLPGMRQALGILGEVKDTGRWATVAYDEIASSAVTQFGKLCREIRASSGDKIVREKGAAASNKPVADAALERFRMEVEPRLTDLLSCFPADQELGRRVREAAGGCLYGLAVDFTWADEYELSAALHEENLELAKGTIHVAMIEEALAKARESARAHRIYGPLQPISAAPSLRTINGFGVSLYGNSDYDPVSKSHVATYYIVGLFLPIIPLARYRVINEVGNSYRFLGKLPLRKGDRWHQAIVAAGFLIWLAVSYASGPSQSSYSANTSAYAPPAYAAGTTPSGGDYSVDSSGIPDFSDLQSSNAQEGVAAGNRGRSDGGDLLPLIDNGRARMKDLEARLTSDGAEIDDLTRRLSSLNLELEMLKDQVDAGASGDVSDYNLKVDEYNNLVRRKRLLVDAYNANVNDYRDLQTRDKRLVAQYNSR